MGVPFFTLDQATAIFVQDSKLLLSETALRKLDLRSKNEAAALDPMGQSGSPKSHLHDTYYIKNDYHDVYYSYSHDTYIYICVCYIYIYGTPPRPTIQSSLMVFTVFFLHFGLYNLGHFLVIKNCIFFAILFPSHPSLSTSHQRFKIQDSRLRKNFLNPRG